MTPYASILKDFVHMASIKSTYKIKCQKVNDMIPCLCYVYSLKKVTSPKADHDVKVPREIDWYTRMYEYMFGQQRKTAATDTNSLICLNEHL